MNLCSHPLTSAALSRIPRAIDSLALWLVLSVLLYILRSPRVAYNEMVVALLDKPQSSRNLSRFTAILTTTTTLIIILICPCSLFKNLVRYISALDPDLTRLAERSLWFSLLVPRAITLQSLYQGLVLQSKQTRGILEAMAVLMIVTTVIYLVGILWHGPAVIIFGTGGLSLGMTAQAIWLWFQCQPVLQAVKKNMTGN